jgi:hypothetical protein
MTNLPHQRDDSPRDPVRDEGDALIDSVEADMQRALSPFEELPEVVEFREHAGHASYHHADNSGGEWGLAKPHQQRCQEIYDAAAPVLQAYLAGIKGEYLIRIRTGE